MTSSSTDHAASPSNHLHTGHTHSPSASASPRGSGSGSGCNGNTNQACAACKYQRRKCNPDCPLAPYFPADQQRRFLHAHRLFGVSNILKTLRPLRPNLCADAMASLIFQAEMRAQDPVGGCYRLILGLERQLEMERAELNAVLHHLALCRHHHQQAAAVPPAGLDVASSNRNQPTMILLDNAEDQEVVVDALYTDHHQEVQHHHAHEEQGRGHNSPQQLFDYFYYDRAAAGGDEEAASSGKPVTLDINVDSMHQFHYADDDRKVDMLHEEMAAGQEQQLDVNCNIDREDYEMKASLLVDVFEMRLPADVNDKAEGVNANIDIDINAVDVNAEVDLNEELHDKDTKNNISTCEEPQMAVESTQCRLGLAFSAL